MPICLHIYAHDFNWVLIQLFFSHPMHILCSNTSAYSFRKSARPLCYIPQTGPQVLNELPHMHNMTGPTV